MHLFPNMLMVTHALCTLFLLSPGQFLSAQWVSAMNIFPDEATQWDTDPAKPVDGRFTSELIGIHYRTKYLSPSSGSIHRLYVTVDKGETWSEIGSSSGQGSGFKLVAAFQQRNTFYIQIMGTGVALKKFTPGEGISDMPWWQASSLSIVDTSLIYRTSAFGGNTYISKYESGTVAPHDSLAGFHGSTPSYIGRDSLFMVAAVPPDANADHLFRKFGSEDWQLLYSSDTLIMRRMQFRGPSVGFMTHADHQVLRTQNGGLDWDVVLTVQHAVASLYFLNDSTGIIGCVNGMIYHTLDGGDTWSEDQLPTTLEVSRVVIFDTGMAYAQCNPTPQIAGTIRIFQNELTVGVWEEVRVDRSPGPDVFPNPTSGHLSISAENSITHIEMCDPVGRIIRRETVHGTEHQVDLHGEAHGSYMLRVHGGDGSSSVHKILKLD